MNDTPMIMGILKAKGDPKNLGAKRICFLQQTGNATKNRAFPVSVGDKQILFPVVKAISSFAIICHHLPAFGIWHFVNKKP